jgi:alanine racemase
MLPHADTAFANTWIEIDRGALAHNTAVFRELAGPERALLAVVKGDAYGHGLVPVARTVLEAGADWLGVFWHGEGLRLREAGIEAPVLVFGATPAPALPAALATGLRLTVASPAAAAELAASREAAPGPVRAHLKLETGTNRQGLREAELPAVADVLRTAGIDIEGAYTHFADIEDTTDHAFAQKQLQRFQGLLGALGGFGVRPHLAHASCSAAAILFPETRFGLVRAGIGLYGLWPSKETRVSAAERGRNRLGLRAAMTWKTRIAQIKDVPAGEFVGYGRTFRATRPTRVAVLPVGYADGYPRTLSGAAHVLAAGVRAPVLGRICMNMTMVDVTDAPAAAGDEVVLLGRQGDEAITAEDLARMAGTINYEIVTRAAPGAPRVLV